jgi:hypothetical protein
MHHAGFAVCSLALSAVAIGQISLSSAQSITIAMPADWVPFSADVRHSYDAAVTTGTFHRRRDGSTAMMLDTPGGVAITIHNLQTRLTYVKLGDRGWATRPVAERGLDPPRHELRLPASQVEDPVLGTVYELINARHGVRTRFAPRLNGFVVGLWGANGISREYMNIRIEDQPDELFLPPPGAKIGHN